MRPQIVIDTSVVTSALRSQRGASHYLLRLVGSSKFGMSLSVPLVLEYEQVAKRLVGQIPLTAADIDDILDFLCHTAEHQQIFYVWRPLLKDPKDDMVLELAVAANCDFVVTFNTRDFVGAEQFGIGIVTPREFLQLIGELP